MKDCDDALGRSPAGRCGPGGPEGGGQVGSPPVDFVSRLEVPLDVRFLAAQLGLCQAAPCGDVDERGGRCGDGSSQGGPRSPCIRLSRGWSVEGARHRGCSDGTSDVLLGLKKALGDGGARAGDSGLRNWFREAWLT